MIGAVIWSLPAPQASALLAFELLPSLPTLFVYADEMIAALDEVLPFLQQHWQSPEGSQR